MTGAAVEIAEYDPTWPSAFEAERGWLAAAWAAALGEIHHVGSTSVPGLAAKPKIDTLVLLDRVPLARPEIDAAIERGFEYRGEYGIAGREYFSRQAGPAVHIHAFARDHAEAVAMLRFRDYLRAHPEAAAEYEALKRRLARRHATDSAAYTEAKTAFVRGVDRLALQDGATGA